jgi:hypothetical protein
LNSLKEGLESHGDKNLTVDEAESKYAWNFLTTLSTEISRHIRVFITTETISTMSRALAVPILKTSLGWLSASFANVAKSVGHKVNCKLARLGLGPYGCRPTLQGGSQRQPPYKANPGFVTCSNKS